MKAGFAEIDITPPLGTRKIGWLKILVGEKANDSLFARAAIFESGGQQAAFIQLDTLIVDAMLVKQIRDCLTANHGFPARNIMVAATHNHAGPAVSDCGEVPRDEEYCQTFLQKLDAMFGQALANLQEAEIGFGRALNWKLAKNRRIVMRNGTVKTHGTFSDPNALYLEGPIDPEVVVLAARATGGGLIGALVNYSCHPTHHGGDTVFSAGWPGVTAREMESRGCPVTMFLNGAQGQTHHACPINGDTPMEECGTMLADSMNAALQDIKWRADAKLGVVSRTLNLPFRKITDDEIHGTTRGAQRFIDPAIYDRMIPHLVKEINRLGTHPAEVQVISLDEYAMVAIPAELFVELGLAIKERVYPRRAVVVGCANGMLGYVPTRQAFTRGGYDAFLTGSKMAHEVGDMLVDCAVELIGQGQTSRDL